MHMVSGGEVGCYNTANKHEALLLKGMSAPGPRFSQQYLFVYYYGLDTGVYGLWVHSRLKIPIYLMLS